MSIPFSRGRALLTLSLMGGASFVAAIALVGTRTASGPPLAQGSTLSVRIASISGLSTDQVIPRALTTITAEVSGGTAHHVDFIVDNRFNDDASFLRSGGGI